MSNNLFFFLLLLKCVLLMVRVKSLLMMLFVFEFVILKIFLMYSMSKSLSDISSCLVFLSVAAGEASLGLSLLVAVMRGYGKDKKKVMSSCEGY